MSTTTVHTMMSTHKTTAFTKEHSHHEHISLVRGARRQSTALLFDSEPESAHKRFVDNPLPH